MSEEQQEKGGAKKTIAVRANRVGFYNGARRREGDVFFVPEDASGKWFEPIDPVLADQAKSADEEAALAKRTAQQQAIEEQKEADEEAAAKKKAAAEKAKQAGQEADLVAQAKKTGLGRFVPGGNKPAAEAQTEEASASAKSPDELAADAVAAATQATADASGGAGADEEDLA